MTYDHWKTTEPESQEDRPRLDPPPAIVTDFWAKPGPLRQFDWSAWYDGDEPNDTGQMAVGFGRTKEEAIDDLVTNFPREDLDHA
jgi:hypothetical protein